MTDRVTRANRIPAGLSDTLRWKNTAGETVPAYGVVQFKSNFVAPNSQASKPDSGEGLFFANGPVPVSATKRGESYLWNHPRLVLISDTPIVGDEVGPVADSWAMSTLGTGFRVIHQVVGGVGAVVPVGGGGGETQIISFQIVSSDATIRSALVDIQQRAFAGTVYGSVLDDTVVTVYDTDGCYLNEPNVDLTARRGKAVLMRVDEEAINLHFADDYDPPEKYWNVLSICCPNFECEVG